MSHYRYPPDTPTATGCAAALFGALSLLFAALVVAFPVWLGRAAFLAPLTFTGWGVLHFAGWMRHARESFETTARGLVVHRGATARLIEWNRIAALRPRDLAGELRVLGRGGETLACIGYRLNGFAGLRKEILAHVKLPAAARHRASLVPVVAVLGVTALLARFAVEWVRDGGVPVISVILIAALLYLGASSWWSVRIGGDGIEVRRFPRSVTVPFAAIRTVTLRTVPVQLGASYDVVSIELKEGKPIEIRYAGGGAAALYSSLAAAFHAHRLAAPAATPAALARP